MRGERRKIKKKAKKIKVWYLILHKNYHIPFKTLLYTAPYIFKCYVLIFVLKIKGWNR